MLNIKSAKFFAENVDNISENPNLFFEGLYIESFGKQVNFISESRNTISNFRLRDNPKFYNKIPLDSKKDFPEVEGDVDEENELNKTLKEFRDDVYKLSHDFIAPFSSKKFLIETVTGGFIQYVLYSNDVPPMVKLIMSVIISYYIFREK